MLKIQTGSSSCVIILHEIYGINPFIKDTCESLSKQNFDVVCPNLLPLEAPFDYAQEETAYKNFMAYAGFDDSADKVKELVKGIKDQYSKIFILGFSVGATVAWLCSEEECVDGIVGYYGSRIRDYVEFHPNCPTLLYFPNVEKSFNVKEVVSKLEKPNVKIEVFDARHGFSDPYTSAYDEELARITFMQTVEFFRYN
ncbi:dienelactone hydrolase family protein [Sporosarcina ureae]|uniref:dienelactone hydrolase family protein n=1 Tax=Sporosarcina ureae TaxID=1571 RepID=UPI0009DC6D96|nr:dienelactone hydrolase family protein [Sporosarcina ureae]ARF18787.1 hypothetical protein SporoP17a_02325 [Sporosarcina ureae]